MQINVRTSLGGSWFLFLQKHDLTLAWIVQYKAQIDFGVGIKLKGGATGHPGSMKVIHNSVRANFHSMSRVSC